jgi:phosphatidylglycerol---prolipoprotein diacylglyceryl transferase
VILPFSPVLVTLGPLAVRWFGLLALLGLGLAVWLSLRDLAQARLSRKAALDALAWGLPAGLLVGHVVHVLGWWDYYLIHAAEVWRFDVDDVSVWGGLLAGAAVFAARLKRHPLRRRRIFDVVAPNAAAGIAVGRLGAFLEGAGQGLPSALPWATQYTSPLAAVPDFGVPRHPLQLYEAMIALVLVFALRALPARLPAGMRAGAFLVLYGLAGLALGPLRLDPAFLFGLPLEQLLALCAVACGASYALLPLLKARRKALVRPGPAAAEDSMAA